MQINWQRTCCAWHGDYAEHATKDGGMARLKRSPEKPGLILVSRFGADNRAVDVDDTGAPVYVEMSADEAAALLA